MCYTFKLWLSNKQIAMIKVLKKSMDNVSWWFNYIATLMILLQVFNEIMQHISIAHSCSSLFPSLKSKLKPITCVV